VLSHVSWARNHSTEPLERRTGPNPRTSCNITGERVRQIENRTLKKLQSLPDAQQLREAS